MRSSHQALSRKTFTSASSHFVQKYPPLTFAQCHSFVIHSAELSSFVCCCEDDTWHDDVLTRYERLKSSRTVVEVHLLTHYAFVITTTTTTTNAAAAAVIYEHEPVILVVKFQFSANCISNYYLVYLCVCYLLSGLSYSRN